MRIGLSQNYLEDVNSMVVALITEIDDADVKRERESPCNNEMDDDVPF
ncbi:MAG TPA: hypothetical protein VK804_05045 [Bradyrhizobium sp.]|nr:hypothetical protein [Bradyrhizobium sp.]HTA99825.1 hypothetical protein [Bradyrhizobium sp.]